MKVDNNNNNVGDGDIDNDDDDSCDDGDNDEGGCLGNRTAIVNSALLMITSIFFSAKIEDVDDTVIGVTMTIFVMGINGKRINATRLALMSRCSRALTLRMAIINFDDGIQLLRG